MADPGALGIGVVQIIVGLMMAGYTAMMATIVWRRQAIPLANRGS